MFFIFQYYDSLASTGRAYLNRLLRYLRDEANDKNHPGFNAREWKLVTCDVATTPQQNNGYDCGVFITMFADFISDGIPLLNFSQSDIPMFREKICSHIIGGELSYSIG